TIVILFSSTTPSPTDIYTLSLHDALPILVHRHLGAPSEEVGTAQQPVASRVASHGWHGVHGDQEILAEEEIEVGGLEIERVGRRSEEHTSELQSRSDLVCRLLLEKKKKE